MTQDIDQSLFRAVKEVQLRFSDLDTLGHVNNSVYFSLLDLAKSDYFDKVQGRKLDWTNVTIVLANVNCSFFKQILYDEPIAVKTRTAAIGDKSLTLEQIIVNTDTGEVKCLSRSIMVYIQPKTLTPEPIPPHWRDALAAYDHL